MYLVTGATGSLGRRVVRLLRERDQTVRSFVRLASKYGELENRGSENFHWQPQGRARYSKKPAAK